MGNKKLTMQKLRQVLRFYSQGKGTKTISSIVVISRNTVKKYLQIFHTLHMDFEDVVSLDDSRLSELFSLEPKPVVHDSRYAVLEPLLPSYCKRLRHKGMSRRKLHKEYIAEHPDGYSLASFDRFIQRHVGMSSPVMHLEHKAGDKLFIDFAGDKLSIVDVGSGEILPVEVFVAILPCSQLTYVEAVMSQKKEDLIAACENSLHYIGGTPLAIVPDNLKAAVTKSSRYEATLNDDFASFAEHYGCAVMPARAYKPRDKALVEGAVKLIYSSIYPYLEGRVFHDLPTLNAAIRVTLEIHNNTPFVGRNYSRRGQFEEIERPTLGKLNPIRYELRKSTVLTVMKNGHVRLGQDAHYYSVPCQYIGKKVKVIYTSTEVDIYSNYTCIASHKRSYARFKYTTVDEHRPAHHRYNGDWNPGKFISEAGAIHKDVEDYITKVLEHKTYPEQAYKSCAGILSFARRVGAKRLINACRWADSYGLYNYPAIEKILNNRQDELPLPEDDATLQNMPLHDNIRGKEYFN